jgi:N-acetylated-alpha-linked acidic dipeptidase
MASKRTIIFGSWDAEEEGLIGSSEWVEQHAQALDHAVAYFNVGVAVPDLTSRFRRSSLKQFMREIAKSVPSPMAIPSTRNGTPIDTVKTNTASMPQPFPAKKYTNKDLGSGSDFTPFLQHAGVPSTDIGSGGPYGVYHLPSTTTTGTFRTLIRTSHTQQWHACRPEALRMADTDILPYDYVAYAREIRAYLESAKRKASDAGLSSANFDAAQAAAGRFATAADRVRHLQVAPNSNPAQLNLVLRQVESAFLSPDGLPNRPWYKHTIYAPGEFTGYAAVVIPGVNEAIESKQAAVTSQQLAVSPKRLTALHKP